MFDFRAERVLRSVDESLALLGVDRLDLVQVHDPEFAPNLNVIIDETLPALDKLRQSGKARYIGINPYPVEMLRTIIEASPVKIDTVFTYCRYGVINNDIVEMLPYLRSKGVGVINGSPTGMALLTERGAPAWHPGRRVSGLVEAAGKAVQLAKTRGYSAPDLAVKQATHTDLVDLNVSAMPTVQLVQRNLRAACEPMGDDERAVLGEMRALFDALPQTQWEREHLASWR